MGGMPYEFIADPTRAGGASVRLVVAKVGRYIGVRQSIIINRFLKEYFKYWLGVKIQRGEIPTAKNWWKTEWVCPKSVTVDAGRDSANERADLDMGRQPPSDDMQARGYSFEKTIRKTARDFAYIKKVSEETGISEDKLWRKSPAGGQGGSWGGKGGAPGGADGQPPANTIPEGAIGIVMPGEDGSPQIVPVTPTQPTPVEEVKDALTNSEPELRPPNIVSPIAPVTESDTGVDILPKQNQGLSRSRERPPYMNR
jgi:hypothetical protein